MDEVRGGGGGLSLDTTTSDFLTNKSFLNSHHTTTLKRKQSMDSTHHFDFTLNCRGSDTADASKKLVDEMDFFSDDKQKRKNMAHHDHNHKVQSLSIKKEDLAINTGLHLLTVNTGSDQSTVDNGLSPNEEDKEAKSKELAAMQAEVARMNEENQRLRGMLSQVTNNYNALQMHLITLMQQRSQRNANEAADEKMDVKKHEIGGTIVPRQFMDLGPASIAADAEEPSNSSMEGGSPDRSSSPNNTNVEIGSNSKENFPADHHDRSNVREESPDQGSQGWIPDKQAKLVNPKASDQQAQEATMRKARVSVRARSEAPMISDGCQWRKYGQKMAKGNPCPRAYYRCTMATGCPVRKQVQRCADDRTILITTYEGNHNHPLPPAAMAMASTTSAAASMLLSGSMSSTDGLMNSNFLARTILPCSSSMATISASAPFPTVTLDLTQTPNPLQFQRPPAQFQLNFPNPPQPPSLPHVFGQTLYNNQSKFSGVQMSAEVEGAQFAHPKPQPGQPPSLADTVSAATAAITADPNFTAALAAAITSIIGGNSNNNNNSSNSSKPGSSSFSAS